MKILERKEARKSEIGGVLEQLSFHRHYLVLRSRRGCVRGGGSYRMKEKGCLTTLLEIWISEKDRGGICARVCVCVEETLTG